jgi:hypothetical protein
VPALLIISAAMVLIDGAARRHGPPRRVSRAGAATVAILLIALVTSFYAREIAVRGTPSWDAALKGAAVTCAREQIPAVAVPTSPPGFGIQLQCDKILDAYPPPRPVPAVAPDGGPPR